MKNQDGTTRETQCVAMTQEDFSKIIVEYVKACVALGNKAEDCGVKISK